MTAPMTMERLAHIVDTLDVEVPSSVRSLGLELAAETTRLLALINTPRTDEFFEAVRIEAAHQVERWGVEHDAGKRAEDWISLFIYLLGKAAKAHYSGDRPKLEHHVITSAAVALNWWRNLTGVSTAMRPGVAESDNQRMDALDLLCEARGLNR